MGSWYFLIIISVPGLVLGSVGETAEGPSQPNLCLPGACSPVGQAHSTRVMTAVGRAGMGLAPGHLTWVGVQGGLQGEENLTRQQGHG